MDGIRSGRVRQVASNIRAALSVHRKPGTLDITEIDAAQPPTLPPRRERT